MSHHGALFLRRGELPVMLDTDTRIPLESLPRFETPFLYINDYDGEQSDGTRVISRVQKVSRQFGIHAEEITEDHDRQRKETGQYHVPDFIERRLGNSALVDAWRADFRQTDEPAITYADARFWIKRQLGYPSIPNLNLTKGEVGWQIDKHVASKHKGYAHIVPTFDKASLITGWQNEETRAWPVVAFSEQVQPLAIVDALRVIFTDDRQFVHAGLPEGCIGQWLNRRDVPVKPEHLLPGGTLPHNVREIASLYDATPEDSIARKWIPRNESARQTAKLPRVAAWVPLRAFVRYGDS